MIPILRYADPEAAITFLTSAFGFEAAAIHRDDDGAVLHVEMTWGTGMVMFGPPSEAFDLIGTGATYVIVTDLDAHFERAKAAGAEIVTEPRDLDYGSRDYTARDPEGHRWFFGTYEPDAEQ